MRASAKLIVLLLAVLLLASCRGVAPGTSSGTPPSAGDSPGHDSAAPSASPTAVAGEPGTPYDADELLSAMRESRRPGGVPDQLETDVIASAIAEQLWTWDGQPWASMSVAGSCGATSCSVDVSGSPSGSDRVDLYSFAVDPGGESVQLIDASLQGLPESLDARLDAIARDGVEAGTLEGLELLAADWLPPPDAGRYRLAYRSGGEEGSPGLDVLVDLSAGTVVSVEDAG